MFNKMPPKTRAALLSLALLLSSCAHTSPGSLPPAPPRIDPLPEAARQQPAPAWCSPTCTEGLTTRRGNSLQRLTAPAAQALPASASTTH